MKHILSFLFVAGFLVMPAQVLAATYSVGPSDTYKTIQACVSAAASGDTCMIHGGTYPETVTISKSGITLRNYSGETPVIDGEGTRKTLVLSSVSNITIDGLGSTKSTKFGIEINSGTNITIKNTEVSYSQDGGIVFLNGSNILVDSSHIHHTNQRALSGGSADHEGVSFFNVNGFEIVNSHVHDNAEEGIDAKYNSRNGKIHNNRSYGNSLNIYIDAANTISVYNNEMYQPSKTTNMGIAVEGSWNPNHDVVYNINVFNNIFRNAKNGMFIWVEPNASSFASIKSVHLNNNLFYANTGYGFQVLSGDQTYLSDFTISNTIFQKNGKTAESSTNMAFSNNIFDTNALGTNTILTTSPGFVDAAANNFRLTSSSGAIDKGIPATVVSSDFDGNARPFNGAYDIGPYEFTGTVVTAPNQSVTVTPTPTKSPVPTATSVPIASTVTATQVPVAQTCPPAGNIGKGIASMSVTVNQAGNYKAWVQMKGNGDAANSIWLQLDGLYCVKVGDLAGMPAGSWTWVDYINGSTTTKIPSPIIAAGTHTLTLIGNAAEPGVAIDRVLLTKDTTCMPSGNGDACIGVVSTPTGTPTGTPANTNTPTVSPTTIPTPVAATYTPTPTMQSSTAPTIQTPSLTTGKKNTQYLATVVATDPTPSDVLTMSVSGLPNGISLKTCTTGGSGFAGITMTCTVSGTPTQRRTSYPKFTVKDAAGNVTTKVLKLIVR